MTQNQIAYARLKEEERSNRAKEDIQKQEADIKGRAQDLQERLEDYTRLGTGAVAGISRLIQAYGKDTGIDAAIKGEARAKNTKIVNFLRSIKDGVSTFMDQDKWEAQKDKWTEQGAQWLANKLNLNKKGN